MEASEGNGKPEQKVSPQDEVMKEASVEAADEQKGSTSQTPEETSQSVPSEQHGGEEPAQEEGAATALSKDTQSVPVQEEDVEQESTESVEKQVPEQKGINGNDDSESISEAHSHRRSTSKVEIIEAPNRGSAPVREAAIPPPSSSSTPLRPDLAQHRHDSRADQPSSYQPSPPRMYLQLRAVALQLPNATATSSNASHIDPPTIILEGRTNLSSARRSFYPKVTRTLPELHLWLLALTLSFPASIFSPFTYPLATLTTGGPPSDAAIRNYLVTITNQLGRILVKPYVLSHPATVALVDCDFTYSPTLPHIGPGSSPLARKRMDEGLSIARAGFDPLRGKKGKGSGLTTNGVVSTWDVDGVAAALGLPTAVYAANHDIPSTASTSSKNPLSLISSFNSSPQRIQNPPPVALPPGEEDEDEEDLTLARNEITRLEMQFERASRAAEMVVEKGGSLNATLNQLTQALGNLERLNSGRLIAKRCHEDEIVNAMIRGIEGWSAAEAGANSTILSTITPSMAYQSLNARMAIDALLRRAAAATHRHSALVVLVQKRREAERLKRARGEIRQEEVDWVLNELKEAQRTTQILTHHLATFTATLKDELKNHSRFTHTDIQANLINHARNSIRAHKFMLNGLCKARDDLMVRREGKKVEGASVSGLLSNGPMPVEPILKEEISAPILEPANGRMEDSLEGRPKEREGEGEEEEGGQGKATASLSDDLTKPEVTEASQLPTTASITSIASRDKALPVAPIDESDSAKQAEQPLGGHLESEETVAAKEEQSRIEVASLPGNNDEPPTPSPLPAQNSPWSETANLGVTQSGFLPSPNPSHRDETSSPMAQSAFLPARNVERYANPFARLDPGISNSTSPAQNPSTLPSGQGAAGKAKNNDVWANRSRISASDAARSLAGRF